MKLLCLMVPCFLVLHFSPKPWLLLDNAKFPQVFGPVPQGHRKDCFVALPVCPASSQPSDRSSSSTRQCHWRGGDRGCYEVSSFLGEHAMSKFQMSLSPGFPPNQQNGFQGLTDLLSLQWSITCLNSPSALPDTDLILRPPRLYCSMVPTLPGSPCKNPGEEIASHHISQPTSTVELAKLQKKLGKKECTTVPL